MTICRCFFSKPFNKYCMSAANSKHRLALYIYPKNLRNYTVPFPVVLNYNELIVERYFSRKRHKSRIAAIASIAFAVYLVIACLLLLFYVRVSFDHGTKCSLVKLDPITFFTFTTEWNENLANFWDDDPMFLWQIKIPSHKDEYSWRQGINTSQNVHKSASRYETFKTFLRITYVLWGKVMFSQVLSVHKGRAGGKVHPVLVLPRGQGRVHPLLVLPRGHLTRWPPYPLVPLDLVWGPWSVLPRNVN